MLNGTAKMIESDAQTILRRILNTTREGVIVVDEKLRIAVSNVAARKAFSRTGDALEGLAVTDVIPDDAVHGAFAHALRTGETTDLHLKFKLTGTRRYDVHITSLGSDTGERFAIGYFYNVTQMHRLENIRQEFLSNISHELRTPLTSILAFVETFEEGALEDEENNRHFLSVIRRNGERMRTLIADILELSQIEAGNISLEKKQLDLSHIATDIITNLSSMAATREIHLENLVPTKTFVHADQKRLEQMLTNLVDNAIRFNRRAGLVTISADADGGFTRIHVADTGEGIAPKELRRVFERFYRVDRARTREVGGTGLGLAIVKHLARLHGGEVSVDSELGTGTRFTVELPDDR